MKKIIVMLISIMMLTAASSAQAQLTNSNGMPLTQDQQQLINKLQLNNQQVETLRHLKVGERRLFNGLTHSTPTNMKVSAPPTILVHVWAAVKPPLMFIVGLALTGLALYAFGSLVYLLVMIGYYETFGRRSRSTY